MKPYIIILSLAILSIFSCHKKESSKSSHSEPTVKLDAPKEQVEGYILLKNNCYACHSATSKSHDDIIAPPMIAIKKRYTKSYATKEDFVNAIVNWSKDPKEEKALMKGAVKRFKLMPKQAFKEDNLRKIADYIYESKIEQPEWFDAHFNEEHGAKGGKEMQGNNWIKKMKLNQGKKWAANIETTQGIEKLQSILNKDTSQTVADFKNLEKKLSDEMAVIFDKCNMKGASHDNLHTFLLPLIKKMDKLKEVSSVEKGKILSNKIKKHLAAYSTFFE